MPTWQFASYLRVGFFELCILAMAWVLSLGCFAMGEWVCTTGSLSWSAVDFYFQTFASHAFQTAVYSALCLTLIACLPVKINPWLVVAVFISIVEAFAAWDQYQFASRRMLLSVFLFHTLACFAVTLLINNMRRVVHIQPLRLRV